MYRIGINRAIRSILDILMEEVLEICAQELKKSIQSWIENKSFGTSEAV